MKKIAFFDIDGTLTSELDGSIPDSVVYAIRKAKAAGHLMFINTGRCFQNVEQRFRSIGFDGYVCGCGTNIYYKEEELFYHHQSHEMVERLLHAAREAGVDILFESKQEVVFDRFRPLRHPKAQKLYYEFCARHYDMSHEIESEDFVCDKFVMWFQTPEQLAAFRKISDPYFACIDRGERFREFVPLSFSKASGIQFLLDHFGLPIEQAYAFGDSNNDLAMLQFVPHSVVMGNAEDPALFEIADYVAGKASEDGIAHALEQLGFLEE